MIKRETDTSQALLFRAAKAMVSFMLAGKHDLNTRFASGHTVLYGAIFGNYRTGVNLLIEKGASVNLKDNEGNTPLHVAVKGGNTNIVSDLLLKGGDLQLRNNSGQTILQYAIVTNINTETFEPIVKLLLDKGAIVNTHDEEMVTPLHNVAARKDSKSVCYLLIAAGANVNARDKKGNTPLHIATQNNCQPAIIHLIGKGASMEVRNHQGLTPLHVAVQSGVLECVTLLVELKPYISAENVNAAIHIILANGCREDILKALSEQK